MQGMVGDRLITYATQLPPHSIEGFLGHDPRSRFWRKLPGDIENIYNKVQRSTSPARMKGIMDYIKQRFHPKAKLLGAFPAVSVAVQRPVEFRAIDEKELPGVGHIQIDMSARNARIVVDGLGRLSAVLELIERSYNSDIEDDKTKELQRLLSSFSVPIVIYAPNPKSGPLTRKEMGQLFFDFNFKAVAVSAKIAISLDMSDPYILATNLLAKECKAIADNGGMEERAASLGKKSTAIVVQPVLLRFVRGAMEGSAFQESNKATVIDPRLTLENIDEHAEQMCEFLDAFATAMGDSFTDDRKSLHLASPGWQTLGIIFNDLYHVLKVPDPIKTAEAIARIDWSRSGPIWKDMVVEKEMKDGTKELVLRSAGASTKREMVKRVRDQIGITGPLEQISNQDG